MQRQVDHKDVCAAPVSASAEEWPQLAPLSLDFSAKAEAFKVSCKKTQEEDFKALISRQPFGWIHTCLGDVWGRLPPPGYRVVLVVNEERSHTARTSFDPEYFKI